MGSPTGSVLLSLLPLIVGAALVPVWAIIALLLLSNARGWIKALAFAAGAIVVRLVQGVVFGYIFGSVDSGGGGGSGAVVSTLLLVIGLLMLITAFRQWRKEDDPDAPPPKWLTTVRDMSAVKAFGVGALLVLIAAKQWVFTLGAINVIGEAAMGQTGNVTAFVIYVLAAELLVLAPILVYVVLPNRSAKTLDATRLWLERHNRGIVIAVSTIFGIFFLWKGITGLV